MLPHAFDCLLRRHHVALGKYPVERLLRLHSSFLLTDTAETRYNLPMRTTSLLKARKRQGLTGAAVARLVGVNRATISRWERGLQMPLHDAATKLEKALGCAIRFERRAA